MILLGWVRLGPLVVCEEKMHVIQFNRTINYQFLLSIAEFYN